MHFKNENDIKSNTLHHKATTSTTSTTSTSSNSSSSTDSGVIIIDNRTGFVKKSNNNDNLKNIVKNNINNITNNSNKNNLNCFGENFTTDDNIENTPKVDDSSSSWNRKLNINNTSNLSNIKCNDHNYSNSSNSSKNNNSNNNQNISDNDECNLAVRNINIENVINISKGHDDSAEVTMNSENHRKHKKCCTQSNKSTNCSPTASIRSIHSTSISICSIDANAIDSSIIDSDSDREADAEGVHTNYVVKKLGQQTTYAAGSPDVPNINKGLTVISQKITPSDIAAGDLLNGGLNPSIIPSKISGGPLTPTTPQIGSIALTNSTDVTFGDKHFYEGPVTIQQILIDRRDKNKDGGENGHDNPIFVKDPGCDTSDTKSHSTSSSTKSPLNFIRRRYSIFITAIIIILGISIGIIVWKMNSIKSKIQIGDGDDSRLNIPINSTIGSNNSDDDDDYKRVLQIMGRDDWFARPPNEELDKLTLPVPRVIIMHTATETCVEKEICSSRLRDIQNFHMDSQEWGDIGYNFLIGGDGLVYTGRGWDYVGAHTKGYNTDKDNIGGGLVLRIVARDGWLAQPPAKSLVPLNLPVKGVIIIATQTDICTTQAMCVYRVRHMQTFHIESLQNDDITYNFLIGGDGNVYEGRGWDFQGAHMKGQNNKTISFAFIGTFKQQSPNHKQMNVTKLLLEEGVRRGKLSSDYKIYSAKKFDPTSLATASSTALYESFKDWPHWSD